MAGPQLEDGFTRIANELLDEICQYQFNGAQYSIIFKIIRMTYGWNRKEHDFSITFLTNSTGLNEKTVRTELKNLIEKNVLKVVSDATRTTSRVLSFNKDYESWNLIRRGNTVEQLNLFDGDGCGSIDPEGVRVNTPGHKVGNDVLGTGQLTPQERNKDLNTLNKGFKEKVELFETFYSIYPRKIKKPYAEQTWKKCCKKDDFDPVLVLSHTQNFAETCNLLGTAPKYIPHPSTFLNQRQYEDYPTVDPEGLAASKQTKFDSNLDFLRGQIGGDSDEPGPNNLTFGESIGSLPEPSA